MPALRLQFALPFGLRALRASVSSVLNLFLKLSPNFLFFLGISVAAR